MEITISIGGQDFPVSCGGTWVEWSEELGRFIQVNAPVSDVLAQISGF